MYLAHQLTRRSVYKEKGGSKAQGQWRPKLVSQPHNSIAKQRDNNCGQITTLFNTRTLNTAVACFTNTTVRCSCTLRYKMAMLRVDTVAYLPAHDPLLEIPYSGSQRSQLATPVLSHPTEQWLEQANDIIIHKYLPGKVIYGLVRCDNKIYCYIALDRKQQTI